MCLAIPGTVITIEGDFAMVSIGGMLTQASLQLIEEVKINDYVLIHSGFIIERISADEAHEILHLITEIMDQEDSTDKDNLNDE